MFVAIQAVKYTYCTLLVEPLESSWILAIEFFTSFTCKKVRRGGIDIVIIKIKQFFTSLYLKFCQFSTVF